MNPPDPSDISARRPPAFPISLTPAERRLLRDTARFRVTLCFSFVILALVCVVWLKHFSRFNSNPFFLAYNVVVYGGLVFAAFSTARYQRRVHRLLQRLLEAAPPGSH
jgi:hypothetical protein